MPAKDHSELYASPRSPPGTGAASFCLGCRGSAIGATRVVRQESAVPFALRPARDRDRVGAVIWAAHRRFHLATLGQWAHRVAAPRERIGHSNTQDFSPVALPPRTFAAPSGPPLLLWLSALAVTIGPGSRSVVTASA